MIKSFADDPTEELYRDGRSRKLPADIWKSGLRALRALDAATALQDLRGTGRKLEEHRDGRHAFRINDRYRLIFRWESPNAYDVEIADPH